MLPSNIEFGFVDQRYAAFELDNLNQAPSAEHSFLLQSTILHDPQGFLARKRQELRGRILAPLTRYYREQFLERLSRRIYSFLEPHPTYKLKIEKSGQIIWVQQAVRCLRNAVASKSYISTGHFIYKKSEVIEFYQRFLPEVERFVQKLYEWKTDPQVRGIMVRDFLQEPDRFFECFRSMMPHLEAVVKKVGDLKLP